MCSTIRPRARAHFFGFLQTRHFCKAPTSSSHHKLISGYLLTPSLRLGGSECVPPTALVRGSPVSVSCKTRIFVKPRPVPCSHYKLILGYLLTRGLRSEGSKCARLSAPIQGPTVSISCKKACLEIPEQ